MIGTILKQGLMMAMYSASGKAVKKSASWLSSNFRREVNLVAKYFAGKRVAGRELAEKVAHYTSNEMYSEATTLWKQHAASVRGRIQRATTPKMYKALTRLGKSAQNEIGFMPANYMMYRVEKHGSVSPAEKEMTKSFTKYYMGMPAITSILFGAAMEAKPGRYRRLGRSIVRKIGPERQVKMYNRTKQAFQGVMQAGKMVANYLAAAAHTRARLTEHRSLLSLMAKKHPAAILARTPEVFREELSRARQGLDSQLDNQISTLKAFREQMNKTKKAEISRLKNAGKKPADINSFSSSFENQINKLERDALSKFNNEIKKPSSTMKFVNEMVSAMRAQNQSNRETFRSVTRAKRKLTSSDFSWIGPEGFEAYEGSGIYQIGTERINLGRLGMNFMKDSLIRSATRKTGSKAILSLFGLKDMLQYKESSHALSTSFTSTRGGSLYFPRTFYDDTFESSMHDQARKMMRMMLPDATPEQVESLLNDRIAEQIKTRGYRNPNTGDVATVLSAAHGELNLKSGDHLVQLPGGETRLLTMVTDKETGTRQLMNVQLGDSEYLKFTRDQSSTPVKLVRNFLGRYEGNVFGDNIKAGPVQTGKVLDIEDTKTLWGKLKDSLDLGKSENQSIFSRLAGIFRKHADPRYPTTLHSTDYLRSPTFIRSILRDDRKFSGRARNIDKLYKLFREQSIEAADDFYYKTTNKFANTQEFMGALSKIGKDISTRMKVDIHDPSQYMLHGNMDWRSGKERVNELIGLITKAGDNVKGSHPFAEDIRALSKVADLFHEGTEDRVLDVVAAHGSGTKVWSKGKYRELSLMDKYNSHALRLIMSLNEMRPSMLSQDMSQVFTKSAYMDNFLNGIRNYAVGEKEISALMASSHLAKGYHQLSYAYNSVGTNLSKEARDGSMNKIEEILTSMTGNTNYDDVLTYYSGKFKYKPFMYTDYDYRLKTDAALHDELYLLPKGSAGTSISRRKVQFGGQVGEIEIAQGAMDAQNIATMSLFHAFNRAASEFLGIGFNEYTTTTPGQYFQKMLTKRVLPGVSMYMGYSVADRLTDRYLDGTPLGEGLTVFGANVLAGARLAAQHALDFTGVSDIAEYMEDLMPGIITSPASGLARGIGPTVAGMALGNKRGGPRGALMGGIIGSALGMLAGGGPLGVFGMWDISKHRGELVKELTGEKEVAIRKGRWWELSSSPFEGDRVLYYRPHIYSMLRSKYKQTPGLKDSIFSDVVGRIAPDYYALQNYYSRPYPTTAGLFADLPIFGNALQLIPGSQYLTGAGITMHEGEYSPASIMGHAREMGYDIGQVAQQYNSQEGIFSNTDGSTGSSPGFGGLSSNFAQNITPTPNPMSRSSMEYSVGESLANVKDLVGLRGFLMGSAFTDITGRNDFFDYAPELASPTDITGIRKEYWDQELGGLAGASEIIRRYIPHRRHQIQVFNPLRNTMPTWLPGNDYYVDLQHGDPYAQVTMGEARLPGAGYETLHDVDLTFPIQGEILGMDEDSQIQYYLGRPAFMHQLNLMQDKLAPVKEELIQSLKQYGLLLRGATTVYNPKYDIDAKVDAILKAYTGEKMAVKVVPRGFAGESTMNAFMIMSDVNRGMLLEVDPESGGVTRRLVERDVNQFENELSRARKSAWAAYGQINDMDKENKAINLANAYSWYDRYKILADVAPYSKEFREASAVVQQQLTAGNLDNSQISDYYTTQDQVEKKMESIPFQEYRFANIGKSLTDYGKAKDAFYTNEYSWLERQVGSAWEHFTHLRTPLHTKLMHQQDPLEEYMRTSIYGKKIKMWQNPIEDFAKSYYYQMLGEDNPIQGSLSWGLGGMLIGGSPLGIAMGITGMANSIANNVTGNVFIPERVKERREIVEQMDAVKYAKYRKLYMETGDRSYLLQAEHTLTASVKKGTILNPTSVGRYYGGGEKEYINQVINNVTSANIHKVAQVLPAPAVASMYKMIGEEGVAQGVITKNQDSLLSRRVPGFDSSIYMPSVPIETPAIQTFERHGVDAHDAGMGWYNQLASITRSERAGIYNKGDTLYPNSYESSVGIKDFSQGIDQKSKLRSALSNIGSNVMIVDDGQDRVNLEIIAGI